MIAIRAHPHFSPFYFSRSNSRCCEYKKHKEKYEKEAFNKEHETERINRTADTIRDETPRRTMPFHRSPPADLHETSDSVVLVVDLPGVKLGTVEVQVKNDLVNVTAERVLKNERLVVVKYCKQFLINPHNVDSMHAKATLVDGVLQVTFPKKAATEARSIPVSTGEKPAYKGQANCVLLTLDIPGVDRSRLELSLKNGRLFVQGERKHGPNLTKAIRRVYEIDSKIVDETSLQAFVQHGVLTVLATRNDPAVANRVNTLTVATSEDADATTFERKVVDLPTESTPNQHEEQVLGKTLTGEAEVVATSVEEVEEVATETISKEEEEIFVETVKEEDNETDAKSNSPFVTAEWDHSLVEVDENELVQD